MVTTTPSRNRHQDVYPGTPSTEKRRLNGLFHRNEWWCNCDPRKRAVDRTVTKATHNKGKRFWACPHPPPDGCGFFLFAHEARVREIGLTPSSSNEAADVPSTATTPSKQPTLTQTRLTDHGVEILGGRRRRSDPETALLENEDGDAGAALHHHQAVSSSQPETGLSSDKGKGKADADRFFTYEPLTPGPSGGRKRGRDEFEEDLLSDMDSEEERELATMTDRSSQRFLRAEAYIGQQTDDGEDDAAAGPSRPVARTLFPQAQGAKRRKSVSFEEPEPSAPTSSKATTIHSNDARFAPPPSTMQMSPPSSMEEAAPFPSSAMTATQQNDGDEDKEGGDNDITEQVMSLLQTQPIDRSVLASVNNLLVVSARRTKGIAMGRDSAREAVKEKKMKIGRLQEKIAALENSERSLNGQITHMKAGLMKMYEAN
ncbi:hypothetical protein MKX08_010369 [Trichoderma sp. CBMAI-0020]|nr:hypothetical protein MKX08_010369 [Trichoderma sp. CBMAI-0020]